MENRQFEAMLAVAQERLAQHAPEDIAGKTGAQYADGSFSLKTLGQTVTPAVGLHDSAAAFQVARADIAALSGPGRRCAADRSDDHIFSIQGRSGARRRS